MTRTSLVLLLALAACGGPAPITEPPDTGLPPADAGCTPESDEDLCYRLGAECGEVSEKDRCGTSRNVDCGGCRAPNTCGGGGTANVCGCRETAAAFCGRLGKSCGLVTAPDRCGRVQTFECGSCTAGLVCGANGVANVCGTGTCTPETDAELCNRLGAECGSVATGDRCGVARTVECGACQAPKSCATTPKPNVCVCVETDLAFCARLGKTCGQVAGTDVCGKARTVTSCGTCPTGQSCSATQVCESSQCTAETDAAFCARLGKDCGTLAGNDNCGKARTAECGGCTAPKVCRENVCGEGTCTPETDAAFCTRLGKTCGPFAGTDNCGAARTVSCGTCSGGQSCTNNVCGGCAETDRQFCQRLGKDCGPVTDFDACDNSRSVASCGNCTPPATCGGGGTANVCGCTAETDAAFCARQGKECGTVSGTDNCGNTRTASCGGCTAPKTCNANLCSCVPETDAAFCARLGWRCDRLVGTDNCGAARSATCGTCSGAQVCSSTHACCTPQTVAAYCSSIGATCGTKYWTDNCGLSQGGSCGTCTAPTVCSTLNSTCCTPETDAQACTRLGLKCGYKYITDNCGQTRSVNCGATCVAPEACGAAGTPNVCGCKVTSGAYCAGTAEVRDSRTGLIWERVPQSDPMAQGRSSALNWCPTQVLTGGHNGWRLPTRAELLSIVDKTQGSPTVDQQVFTLRASKYWTSDLMSPGSNYAYVVDFATGTSSSVQHNLGSTSHLVLCVYGP